jgi:WD40 repeat protein
LVWNAAFRPDGARLATGSDDGTLRIWDPATGSQLAAIKCFGGYSVHGVAYSPDGTLLATGGADLVRLWALP